MNLTIAVDDFSGGAGKIAQLLALEAAKHGHVVTLLLARRQTMPRFDLSSLSVQDILPGEQMTGSNILRSVLAIRRYLKTTSPDLFISFIHNINIIAGLSHIGFRNPLIVSERGDPVRTEMDRVWKILRFFAYQRANKITVLFDAFQDFSAGRYKHKVSTLHNPVLVPPCEKPLDQPRQPDQKWTFLALSRLAKSKRLDLMLELFSELHLRYPNTQLKIFGEGKERESLNANIVELGLQDSVILSPNTRNIYDELCQADIYLMTSRYEGFPNALVEALSVGLPAVVFECHDGMKELVQHGNNSLLIQENDRAGFIQAVEQLMSDPALYQRISLNARSVTRKFSFDNFYVEWDRLFQEFQ